MALIAVVTLTVGLANHAFSGFPKGYDAYGHMSKIKLLVDYFPNADWNYQWYSGEFFSEASFPPLFHYLGAMLVGWFGLSLPNAVTFMAAASFVVIGCSLYGLVRVATGSRAAGLVAGLVLLTSSGYWSYVLQGGLYPRIAGMAFLALFVFFAALHFKRPTAAIHIAMVLSLAAALSAHLLIGAVGVALAVLLVLALPATAGVRLVEAVKILVPAALLSAYFYLPYAAALSQPQPVPPFTSDYAAISLAALVGRGAAGTPLESLPFFLLPAAIAVPAAAYACRRLPREAFGRRLMLVLAVAGAGSLVYAVVGLPAPHLFIYNFQPGQALFFASWFLAGLVGVAVGGHVIPVRGLAVLILALLAFIAFAPARIAEGVVNADNPAKSRLQGALEIDPTDKQYRVGVNWDSGSDWINARFDVPQTRGYQQQGVLNPDWQYWFEHSVWSSDANYSEADFLLDWNAVKSFYGGPDGLVVNRFDARPDLYRRVNAGAGVATYQYAESSPILSARTTRTALVIGNVPSYAYLFRALALSGFDSQAFIPVRGGAYVDDHAPSELRKFDLVVLYGYQAHDLTKSFRLLDGYVRNGGTLLVEANSSPLESADSAPSPLPGSTIRTARTGPDWMLSRGSSSISEGIDLAAFAPAAYNGGPWGISYIPESAIAPWAEPVLLSDGRPVLVAGTLGNGRVVWSGMNLPYHAASTRTVEESRLLANAITWAAPNQAASPPFGSSFVNPQVRRVDVAGPAGGVLFKENWTANWHAQVNGKPAVLYRAGPDFMYVPLGPDVAYPATVEFTFSRTGLESAGDGVSALALLWLLGWPLVRRVRRSRRS